MAFHEVLFEFAQRFEGIRTLRWKRLQHQTHADVGVVRNFFEVRVKRLTHVISPKVIVETHHEHQGRIPRFRSSRQTCVQG